jgi:sulfur carrier protein
MNLTVNGEARTLEEGSTLQALVPQPQGVAVALNGAVVPASAWAETRLADDDVVELVTAHQGG